MSAVSVPARIAVPLLAALVVACAPATRSVRRDDAAADDAGRRAALERIERWGFDGRVAVSDGKDGGSGRIRWRQDGDRYDISVSAPVSNETWRLTGDARGARLEGAKRGPLEGPDPEALLERAVGWHLPVARMRDWVRALASSGGAARVQRGADGLPALIAQSGWSIEYRRYDAATQPVPLPVRMRASRAPHEVRLAVARWTLE